MTILGSSIDTSKFSVVIRDCVVKHYPTYAQCIIWCYLRGYVNINVGNGVHQLQYHVYITPIKERLI